MWINGAWMHADGEGNTGGGAIKKREISHILLSINLHFLVVQFADTFEELAHSPLTIEVLNKGGMGLDKGLSPTFDVLVDKYFTIPDPENPDGAITRLKEGKIAREGCYFNTE